MGSNIIKNPLVVAVAVCAASVVTSAKGPDPRLATVKVAWVQPVDDLGDDKPLAACVAEHLARETPITLATTKDEADLVLKVQAHLPGDTMRSMTGSLGTARVRAELQDGTVLWSGVETLTARESLARQKASDIPCSLADGLLDKLRQAMRKARDSK